MSLLEVEGLRIDYAAEETPAVADLSFALARGESLGLVGESGSGKTQTALAIMGLLPADARPYGSIRFEGGELLGAGERRLNRIRARRIAMIFQDPGQALNPYLTIGGQLGRILEAHAVVPRRAIRARTLELLERVGLPDAARQAASFPHQLSGGMRQRAMIAMALSAEPAVLVADEPTTALDVTVQAQILDLLRRLRADTGIALLLITHDLAVVAGNCDRMLVMHRGRPLESGTTRDVFAAPAHPHTQALLAAAPRIDAPVAAAPLPGNTAGVVLDVRELTVSYAERNGAGRSRREMCRAVRSVSFEVREGETLAIVGESGSGKTTVARAILGLVGPQGGSILFRGEPLAPLTGGRARRLRRRLQMVFQDPVGSLNPMMRVSEALLEAIRLRRDLPRDRRRAGMEKMLGRVGLDQALQHRFPHELSGGQAQRVAIARALLLDPEVLVCDEAVAALDGTVRGEILDLLLGLQRESGLSLVFITHDLAVVRRISHRVMVMHMGRVCELADNEALFGQPRHPYTRALIAAVPAPDPPTQSGQTSANA